MIHTHTHTHTHTHRYVHVYINIHIYEEFMQIRKFALKKYGVLSFILFVYTYTQVFVVYI